MLFIALFTSALPLFSAYSLCNPSDVKGPVSIPITNVLVTSPIIANGNIQIIDGCTVIILFNVSLKLLDSHCKMQVLPNGMVEWVLV